MQYFNPPDWSNSSGLLKNKTGDCFSTRMMLLDALLWQYHPLSGSQTYRRRFSLRSASGEERVGIRWTFSTLGRWLPVRPRICFFTFQHTCTDGHGTYSTPEQNPTWVYLKSEGAIKIFKMNHHMMVCLHASIHFPMWPPCGIHLLHSDGVKMWCKFAFLKARC